MVAVASFVSAFPADLSASIPAPYRQG